MGELLGSTEVAAAAAQKAALFAGAAGRPVQPGLTGLVLPVPPLSSAGAAPVPGMFPHPVGLQEACWAEGGRARNRLLSSPSHRGRSLGFFYEMESQFYESFLDVYWIWHHPPPLTCLPVPSSRAPVPVSSLKSSIHVCCRETSVGACVLHMHK